ncbi:uncharacterized protein LOC117318873 [Pecten maximus]|uniref:uncharacterized protein LOC117318873 n=1 Tax=Pecten maximus TaxID=6579 RepID=UPI0014581CBE|nr:uncharacterized protein LOC117318873 [Pecten maximus]
MAIQRNIFNEATQLQQENPNTNRNQLRDLITQSQSNLDRISSTDRLLFADVHGALADLLLLVDRPAPAMSATEATVRLGLDRNENSGSRRGRGRPAKEIDLQFVKDQLQNGFTAKAIAQQLNCSPPLLYKFLKSHDLSVRGVKYSTISDADLHNTIANLHESHPNSGNEMMNGYLKGQGIQVQRRRVRETLTAVDPPAAAQRWSAAISRRVYRVPVPNSLWHIDGHMRLIRWGIVTHGCVGYSRTMIYLQAGTNNKSSTVLQLFVDGVLSYGLPSFVRSDKGGENVQVGLFMNLMRNEETGGCITGRSVFNQRIERMWRDVHKDVIDKFYQTFYQLEDELHLNPDNDVHITAIHHVYLPDINRSLGELRQGWNNHRLRTEWNRTPNQVWFEGMANGSAHAPVRELQSERNTSDSIEEKLRSFGLTLQDVQPEQVDDMERVVVQRRGVDLVADFVAQLERETAHMQLREKYLHYVSKINDYLA